MSANKNRKVEVRESGANIAIVDTAESCGRVVFVNPPERIYLVKNDSAVLLDLTLQVAYVAGVEVDRSFRVLETQLGEAVDPNHLELCIDPVGLGLHVERFVPAEAPEDDLLKGRNVIVIRLDREALVSAADDHLTHNSSPSVGAPAGAVCDNSNPTDGDQEEGAVANPHAAAPESPMKEEPV